MARDLSCLELGVFLESRHRQPKPVQHVAKGLGGRRESLQNGRSGAAAADLLPEHSGDDTDLARGGYSAHRSILAALPTTMAPNMAPK